MYWKNIYCQMSEDIIEFHVSGEKEFGTMYELLEKISEERLSSGISYGNGVFSIQLIDSSATLLLGIILSPDITFYSPS